MVVDITSKNMSDLGIDKQETFLLDTNILYWLFSGTPVKPNDIQKVTEYTRFVRDLIANGNILWTSAGNVQELLHLIENDEFQFYKVSTHNQGTSKKTYRADTSERNKLKIKEQATLSSIKGLCEIYRLTITEKQIDCFVNSFDRHTYDLMDFFIAENAKNNGRVNVVTDDKDFRSDVKMQVYTVV